jgi:hypothetical protein
MRQNKSGFVETVVAELSKAELMKHTEEISRWERLSGSKEEAEAFKYINDFLKSLKAEVKKYDADTFISIPVEGRVSFDGQDIIANPPAMSGSTPSSGVTAKAKYIDSQTLENLDLKGLIAVMDGMPMPSIMSSLEKSKCVGAIFVQSAELVSQSILSPVWGSPSTLNIHLLPSLPVVSINTVAGESLKKRIDQKPNEPITLSAKLDTGWRKIPVLTAEIRAPKKTDDFVMFSGHVDSWYYGAMDNGSANAAMLEIARVISLKRNGMKRNLRLAFWSGHSHGRYAGSAWYADEFWQDLHDNCVVHINIDSVGAKNANVLTQAHVMAETKAIAAEYINEFAGQELEGVRVGRAGDQSFWGHGVPSLFLTLSEQPPVGAKGTAFAKIIGGSTKTSGLGWWWHTSADTFDKIDPDNLLRDTKIYGASIARFCGDDILPIDLRPAIDEIIKQVDHWQKEAGSSFDLSPLTEKLCILKKKTGEFYSLIDSGIEDEAKIRVVNTLIKELDRVLIPINYVGCDKFHQDPAINQPPVPALSLLKGLKDEKNGDRINEVVVEAKRQRNRIYAELTEGIKLLDEALKKMQKQ